MMPCSECYQKQECVENHITHFLSIMDTSKVRTQVSTATCKICTFNHVHVILGDAPSRLDTMKFSNLTA